MNLMGFMRMSIMMRLSRVGEARGMDCKEKLNRQPRKSKRMARMRAKEGC
jgi:hypothetical protein